MHIITYASQISKQPKRFICGIYHGTQTFLNIEVSGEFILQLLEDANTVWLICRAKSLEKSLIK